MSIERKQAMPNLHRFAQTQVKERQADVVQTSKRISAKQRELDQRKWTSKELLSRFTPVLSLGKSRILHVAAGHHHTLLLDEAGQVLSFGEGSHGQLGHGDKRNLASPRVLARLQREVLGKENNVVALAAGMTFSIALTSSGRLLSWGYGPYGELGRGEQATSSSLPQELIQVPTAIGECGYSAVTCGAHHVLALSASDSRTLCVWGRNEFGQLGNGTRRNVFAPETLNRAATWWTCSVISMSAGDRHSAIITEAGDLWCWGRGRHGQLCQAVPNRGGKTPDTVTPISLQSDLHPKPLCVVRIREPAEDVKHFDELVDDMLISVDEDGAAQCSEAHNAWDAGQLVSTSQVDILRDGIAQPVDILLFAGRSPFFAPGQLPARTLSPGATARRAREFSEKFQKQYKKDIPPVLVRRKTQYLKRNIDFKGASAMEKYESIIAKHAAEWGDILEEQGWAREVDSGNYIPYKTLYDLQAYGRRLEDDNTILEMRRIFFHFDKDASGEIDAYEMCVAMQQLGYSVSVRRAKRIIKRYDNDKNGTISLEEFLDFCYAEIIRKGRSIGWLRRLFNRRQVVARTDPPPAVPSKLPPAKLRREERERMLWFKYRRRLRAPGRVFPDTYARFVKAFMQECVEAEIWNTIPARLRKQLCVPNSQPLYHIGEIDLSECDVTDAYVDALCTALKCAPVVRRLDLRHNHITHVGAELLQEVLLRHDELADYQDCAKCLACGDLLAFDDPRDPRTPSQSCGCSPGSRGGRLYQLPVYWLEHVVIEDPMTKAQRQASHKVGLALELDAFTARALRKQLSMRMFLHGHISKVREDDPETDANSQPTKTFRERDFEGWIKQRIARAQSDLERALTMHVDNDVKIREIRRVFVEADKDNSGYLDQKELRRCLTHLGIDRKLAKEVFQEIDKDNNGFVTLDELEQCIDMLISRSDVKFLGRKRKNAVSEKELQREKDEITSLIKDLGHFGAMMWERFHLLQYRSHANGRLQNNTLSLKRKFFNASRQAFHASDPPLHENAILGMIEDARVKCWNDLKSSFPWSAESETWSACEASLLKFSDILKMHYVSLNRQVCVVEACPGLRHAVLLTQRRIPWIRGYQDDGKQETRHLWNERIVHGIQSLDTVLAD
ncbi:E3 ubiquitin-protein ligase HERC2 [Hondaea fermentalgiana]|uniref:E3 ubiquitin-protein ligase HERC2 n=1 Tax=Hondaea fermentalgiana TaxID=2315210 RepID=A0A2R5GX72_9STRA|nr:E3 ubiquitin-protein ligase HERC2 [Hondaea fermentalgiana]|eukprot:GBG34929.1 E3 ubiquitin-protein ligase HERC2 [Hondaea fermentalgiana]